MRCRARLAAVALLVGATAGCVTPSRTDVDYQHKAANTAKAALSTLATARLAVQAAERRRAPDPYLSVVLSQSEQDLDSVQGSFSAVQPPSHAADRIRSEVGDLLTDAADTLSALRIAVRRRQLDALPELAAPLTEVMAKLTGVQDRYA